MIKGLVSIIVPVYNSEKYLNTCIKSLLNQNYPDVEVILVNDGSTDSSVSICNKYNKKYQRVRLINQKNQGPSVARNQGIMNARGEYIQFVDSDDFIEIDMTDKLVKAIEEKVELVICGYKVIYEGKDITSVWKQPIEKKYSRNEFLMSFGKYYIDNFINSLWNKLYSINIINEFNLSFKENISLGEDLLFNIEYIKRCNSINIINNSLYNYFCRQSGSLTTNFINDIFENQKMLFLFVEKFLIDSDSYNYENEKFLMTGFTNSIIGSLATLFHKDCKFENQSKHLYIHKIIEDDLVIKNLKYFKNSNIQTRILGVLIEHRLVRGIELYFRIKKLKSAIKTTFRRKNSKLETNQRTLFLVD